MIAGGESRYFLRFNGHPPFFVGGYVARESDWPYFASSWAERILNSKPKIPYLHMTALRRSKFRKKHGLCNLDAQNKVREAICIINSMGGVGATAGTIDQPHLDAVGKKLRSVGVPRGLGFKDPDYLCFIAYVWQTLVHLKRTAPEVERVDFVVSKKAKVSEHYREFTDSIRRSLETLAPIAAPLVGDLIPASMQERLPLQAADLLCWHLQRIK